MRKPLSPDQRKWVDETLAGMSLEEKVGHLLCPEDREYSEDEWLQIQKDVPFGSAFFTFTPPERPLSCIKAIQKMARIPVLIASDLEHGAGAMIPHCTDFPNAMAAGAADDVRLVRAMGRATAREGRANGVHWTFSPVVDLNVNFQNPVTNIRALGDRAGRVSRLAQAWIEGIQESGEMAASAKHFPGDGMDDRDQHCCTSVNTCSLSRWWATYGRVWQAVIQAGTLSVMVGHISFPEYEGLADRPADALPATLSQRLQVDLLRRELGFEGVIVSDAAPMIGIASRVRADEQAVQNILAGSDVYLFANPREDFGFLLQAVRGGRISLERLEQKVRRVLELKVRLGLPQSLQGELISPHETTHYRSQATEMAEKSITLLRASRMTPAALKPGAHILTVTLKYVNNRRDLDREQEWIDGELRRRGFEVDHLQNPSADALMVKPVQYDAVFVNIVTYPHALFGSMRLTGGMISAYWRGFYANHDHIVFTSFGSPYILYEQPHLPNLYLAYGFGEFAQKAAVRAWLGEIEPRGRCPVRLPEKMMGLK